MAISFLLRRSIALSLLFAMCAFVSQGVFGIGMPILVEAQMLRFAPEMESMALRTPFSQTAVFPNGTKIQRTFTEPVFVLSNGQFVQKNLSSQPFFEDGIVVKGDFGTRVIPLQKDLSLFQSFFASSSQQGAFLSKELFLVIGVVVTLGGVWFRIRGFRLSSQSLGILQWQRFRRSLLRSVAQAIKFFSFWSTKLTALHVHLFLFLSSFEFERGDFSYKEPLLLSFSFG